MNDDDIFLVNVDGTGQKQVTKGKVLQIAPPAEEPPGVSQLGSLISWTPDGQLMYTVPKADGGVYTIKPDGTGTKVFLKQPYILSWSPDGKQLAGLRLSSKLDEIGIYILNADGTGKPKQILKFGQLGAGLGVSAPTWRPRISQ